MPITDFIESTEVLLTQTVTRLREIVGLKVSLYDGTSPQGAIHHLESIKHLPAAVVMYLGGIAENHPRRASTISVLLVAKVGKQGVSGPAARQLVDDAIAKLDEYTYNGATWKYSRDLAVDLKADWSAYVVDFKVGDY